MELIIDFSSDLRNEKYNIFYLQYLKIFDIMLLNE